MTFYSWNIGCFQGHWHHNSWLSVSGLDHWLEVGTTPHCHGQRVIAVYLSPVAISVWFPCKYLCLAANVAVYGCGVVRSPPHESHAAAPRRVSCVLFMRSAVAHDALLTRASNLEHLRVLQHELQTATKMWGLEVTKSELCRDNDLLAIPYWLNEYSHYI